MGSGARKPDRHVIQRFAQRVQCQERLGQDHGVQAPGVVDVVAPGEQRQDHQDPHDADPEIRDRPRLGGPVTGRAGRGSMSPEGGLRTPSLESGVLESITRDRLIKALDVEEGAWKVEDLRAATEAFLASTTREIQPVGAIDGTALADAPGPRTREAVQAFQETLGREL